MKNTCLGLVIAFAFVVCCAGAATAQSAYSKAVQKACAADYHEHCGEYGLETAGLRSCMDRNVSSGTKLEAESLIL
jgi:hypothetical protein